MKESIYPQMKIIETDKYILRPICQEDAPSMFEYYSQEKVVKYLPIKVHKSISETKRFIRKNFIDSYKKGNVNHWAIIDKHNKKLIGNIGLKSEYQRLENKSLSNLKLIIGQACKYIENLKHERILYGIPLSKTGKSEKAIVECFWFFYNCFYEMCEGEKEKLAQIRSIIVDMKVIHIMSQDELDCYEVFEILNARGVSLKDSELLKNYIFKYVQPEYSIDMAKIKWNKIVENMGKCKDNIDQFLVHYFVARFPKNPQMLMFLK